MNSKAKGRGIQISEHLENENLQKKKNAERKTNFFFEGPKHLIYNHYFSLPTNESLLQYHYLS